MAITPIQFEPSDLAPSSRTYVPGTFPRTRFESQDGVTTFIQYGNRRVNATLQLEFRNIFDNQVQDIIDTYDTVMKGEERRVDFTGTKVFGGISDEGLLKEMQNVYNDGEPKLCWLFDGPPQVQSIRPGVSTVSCAFTGYVLQASIG